MKHILSISCYFLCLFALIGCPSPFSESMYYDIEKKQQAKDSSNDIVPPPIVDEDEDGGSGEPEEDVPEGSTLITIFEVLQPNGTINEELLVKFPQDVQDKVRASLQNITTFTTDSFQSKHIIAKFLKGNVPDMKYAEGGWNPSSDNKYLGTTTEDKYVYGGDKTTADAPPLGVSDITNVKYYMYDGKNPFYSRTGPFNTAAYGDKTDTIMNRFVFYRFTGSATLGVRLDNMLVAVDTYTGLVFVFAKPTDSSGLGVPTRWEAVDVAATAPDGKKYKFYEYDPAGHIDSNGKFVLEDWYVASQTAASKFPDVKDANYDPPNTGKSPYLHKVVIGGDGSVVEPEKPESFTPIITTTTLEADGTLVETEAGEHKGKYYIDINLTSPEKEFAVDYELYTREGESGNWSNEAVAIVNVPAKTTGASIPMYRHYDGLILSAFPQYKVIAKDTVAGEKLGDSTELVEGEGEAVTVVAAVIGSRMLTEREMLLASIETIRVATSQLWYKQQNAGDITKRDAPVPLKEGFRDGTTGTYYHGADRHCAYSFNYRHYQRFDDYKNSLVTLNGAFMKNRGGGLGDTSHQGIWLHNDTSVCDDTGFPFAKYPHTTGGGWKPKEKKMYHKWPSSFGVSPLIDTLTATFEGVSIDIVLNNITIDNDDKNAPEWSSGSFKVTQDGVEKEYNSGDVPFGFFMDAATFRSQIAGDGGYTQK